jgi:hypothetical protein
VSALRVAGAALAPGAAPHDPAAVLAGATRIAVDLAADPDVPASCLRVLPTPGPDDWRALFGPRTPQIKSIAADGDKLRLELGLGGEETPGGLAFTIYRDVVRVADDLPGETTGWTDPDSDPTAPRSPCYAVEATFVASGTRSQHSRATCWWGADFEAIQTIGAGDFEAVGGTLVDEHGRLHYQAWGDPGHSLTVRGLRPRRDGAQLLQVTYGNGAGPINTGVACGIKRVSVFDEASDELVANGVLVMPQLGRWDRWASSSFVAASLSASASYRVVIASDASTANMSTLAHFAGYRGGSGGVDGAFQRVNIAELKLLAR